MQWGMPISAVFSITSSSSPGVFTNEPSYSFLRSAGGATVYVLNAIAPARAILSNSEVFSTPAAAISPKSTIDLLLTSAIFSLNNFSFVTTGWVVGMSNTVVVPPAAAPLLPLSKSSLWVIPGSLKWTWESMSPGITDRPVASITIEGLANSSPLAATLAIFPSETKTSAGLIPSWAITVPFLITRSKEATRLVNLDLIYVF